jgi:hypothetical protein
MRIVFWEGEWMGGGGIFCCLFHLIIKAPITYTKCSYGGRRGHVRMIVEFETTCAINISCKFESHSSRGELDSTLCDKVCRGHAAGRWFSPGTPVSSTNKKCVNLREFNTRGQLAMWSILHRITCSTKMLARAMQQSRSYIYL